MPISDQRRTPDASYPTTERGNYWRSRHSYRPPSFYGESIQKRCDASVYLRICSYFGNWGRLQPMKTEIKWFESATALRNLPSSARSVNVGSDVVQPASVVSDLGVQLDGHASTRLQNDANVLLPPPPTATGSTATWSWRHRQPRRRICALTTRLLQRSTLSLTYLLILTAQLS